MAWALFRRGDHVVMNILISLLFANSALVDPVKLHFFLVAPTYSLIEFKYDLYPKNIVTM